MTDVLLLSLGTDASDLVARLLLELVVDRYEFLLLLEEDVQEPPKTLQSIPNHL